MNMNDLFAFLNTSNSSAIQTTATREPRSTMTQLEKFCIVFKRNAPSYGCSSWARGQPLPPQIIN